MASNSEGRWSNFLGKNINKLSVKEDQKKFFLNKRYFPPPTKKADTVVSTF